MLKISQDDPLIFRCLPFNDQDESVWSEPSNTWHAPTKLEKKHCKECEAEMDGKIIILFYFILWGGKDEMRWDEVMKVPFISTSIGLGWCKCATVQVTTIEMRIAKINIKFLCMYLSGCSNRTLLIKRVNIMLISRS